MDEYADLLGEPTEEERAQLLAQALGANTLTKRSQLLDDQIAQSQAMAQALQGKTYGGGIGGALGILAKGIHGLATKFETDKLRAEQRGVLDKMGQAEGAEQRLKEIDAKPGRRLQILLGRQGLQKGAADLQKSQSDMAYESSPVGPEEIQLAKTFGLDIRPGMTRREAHNILSLAEKAYAARQMAEERRLTRDAMRTQREDAAADKAEDKLLNRTEKLSKRVEESAPVVASLRTIAGLIGPEGFDTTANVEGVGLGQALLDKLPGGNLLRGDKAKQMRGAASDLAANVLRAYSGAAASDRELMRTLERLGQGDYSNDSEFLNALKRVRNFVGVQMKQAEAGVGHEAAQRFEEEGGVSSRQAEQIGAPAAPTRPQGDAPPPGMKWQRNKKTGERRLVPIGG